MKKSNFLKLMFLLLAAVAVPFVVNIAYAGPGGGTYYANSPAGIQTTSMGIQNTGIPLRKFVDSLPGLGYANRNNLGHYIPVAVSDTGTYGGSDYYVIGLRDYTEQLHSDLPKATKLRGYYQINAGDTPDATVQNVNQYLGPLIIAKKDRPVRILFENHLGVGAAGNLFIPVDTTVMGAGYGPLGAAGGFYTQNRATLHLHGGNTPWISDGTPHQWITPVGENTTTYLKGVSQQNVPDMDGGVEPQGKATFYYTNQQSARLMFYHDHAYGITRLNVYAGEAAGYLLWDQYEEDLISGTNVNGANPTSAKVIPDLGGVYHYGIPLVIQDKTFVPQNIATQDSKWDTVNWGQAGDLWFPHVYEPNQNPAAGAGGVNPFGRWDYGPWFWPPVIVDAAHSTLPDPSTTPEAFMDTPLVNGAAYPYLTVEPKAYRFRILNACNDRMLNLQLYEAEPLHISIISNGSGYSASPVVTFTGGGATTQATGTAIVTKIVNSVTVVNGGTGYTSAPSVSFIGGGGTNAAATATVSGGAVTGITITNGGTGYTSAPTVNFGGGGGTSAAATATITGSISGITVTNNGTGYTSAPTVTITDSTGAGASAVASVNTEVKMLTALPPTPTSTLQLCSTATATNQAGLAIAAIDGGTGLPLNGTGLPANCWPTTWPVDGRDGGVPDPTTAGPAIIQIGTEGGFLPAPVVIPPTPVGFDYNRRSIVVLNVLNKALFIAPAERADIIVDFSAFAGKDIILYNDSPAPVPAFDPRYDYYTDNMDQSGGGGAPPTLTGYGPNTRTIMQFRVGTTVTTPSTVNLTALQTGITAAFNASQPAPHVPQTTYPAPNNAATDTYAKIQDYNLTFTPIGATRPITIYGRTKAIQELWDPYGRMNATLGVELPFTNNNIQTTIPLGYIDPTTEIVPEGETQLWKITHNGVDSHPVHFHLFNVQVINRVGWDGQIRIPDDNELGWKETVRMNPLEDVMVALQPKTQTGLPFVVPLSSRSSDITMPSTDNITVISPITGNAITVSNAAQSFGWEYVWHCHILGHEENDFMRSFIMLVSSAVPNAPANLTATIVPPVAPAATGNTVKLDWTAGPSLTNPDSPNGLRVELSSNGGFTPITTVYPGLKPIDSISVTAGGSGYSATPTITISGGLGSGAAATATVVGGVITGITVTNPGTAYTLPTTVTITDTTGTGATAVANFAYTYTDTVVTSNTTYNYRVVAFNTKGDSAPSTTATILTPTWTPATGVAITPSLTSPQLAGTAVTFTASGTGGSAAYDYRFWLNGVLVQDYGVGSTWTMPASTSPGSYVIAVDVRTSGAVNRDTFNSLTFVLTQPPSLPGAPTMGTATAVPCGASVSFTAPVSSGSSAITSYTVTSSPGGITGTGASSPITVLGLTNGTTYNFTVVATNAVGTGPSSATSNSVAPLPPAVDFSGTPLSGSAPLAVNFTDLSSCGTSWSWTFGDTGTSTLQNPSHTYTPVWGSSFSVSYSVSLTTTIASASGSLTKTSYITAQCPNLPAKNVRTGTTYTSLQAAHDAASGGDTILSHALTFTENLTISKAITFDGGYNCDYASHIGRTTLTGNLAVGAGVFTVDMDNFNVQ